MPLQSVAASRIDGNVDAYYLIIDVSKSMNEVPQPPSVPVAWQSTKLTEVKRQLVELCERLPTESCVRLFLFDEGPPREGPRFDSLDAVGQRSLSEFFSSLQAKGQRTYAWRTLDHVLNVAGDELTTSARTAGIRILMFTDGVDNDPARPSLETVLAKHRSLLQNKNGTIHLSYLTLGFTLSAEMRNIFVSNGVEAVASLRPEDLIPLIPNFSCVPERPMENDEVQFIDRSTGIIVGYSWSFGENSESHEKAPKYRFSKAGEHKIRLTIRGSAGRTQSVEKTIAVVPMAPLVPRFEALPKEVKLGESVLFRNLTSGAALNCSWDFGDGSGSSEINPTHKFETAGEYFVVLTVTSADGRRQQTKNRILIHAPPAPEPKFEIFPESVSVGGTVLFRNNTQGTNLNFKWSFGDGGESTNTEPRHAYHNAGVFVVTLAAEARLGERKPITIAKSVTVSPPKLPPVEFLAPSQAVADELIQFANETPGEELKFHWSFGDGHNSEERSPKHVYKLKGDRPATYIVKLSAIHSSGIRAESPAKAIRIVPPKTEAPPVPGFRVLSGKSKVGIPIQIADESRGLVVAYHYDLNGEGAATNKNPSFTFLTPGLKTIRQLVIGPGGECWTTNRITVEPLYLAPAVVSASVSPTNGRAPLQVVFNADVSGDYAGVRWILAGQTISTNLRFAHTFKNPIQAIVTLVVTPKDTAATPASTAVRINVIKPSPIWLKGLFATILLLVGVGVLVWRLRPKSLIGELSWTYGSESGGTTLTGTSMNLRELKIPGWTPKCDAIIRNKGGRCIMEGKATELELAHRMKFQLDGAVFTYRNEAQSI